MPVVFRTNFWERSVTVGKLVITPVITISLPSHSSGILCSRPRPPCSSAQKIPNPKAPIGLVNTCKSNNKDATSKSQVKCGSGSVVQLVVAVIPREAQISNLVYCLILNVYFSEP